MGSGPCRPSCDGGRGPRLACLCSQVVTNCSQVVTSCPLMVTSCPQVVTNCSQSSGDHNMRPNALAHPIHIFDLHICTLARHIPTPKKQDKKIIYIFHQ